MLVSDVPQQYVQVQIQFNNYLNRYYRATLTDDQAHLIYQDKMESSYYCHSESRQI